MSRATETSVKDYLDMPLGRIKKIQKALINVVQREKEAREEK